MEEIQTCGMDARLLLDQLRIRGWKDEGQYGRQSDRDGARTSG